MRIWCWLLPPYALRFATLFSIAHAAPRMHSHYPPVRHVTATVVVVRRGVSTNTCTQSCAALSACVSCCLFYTHQNWLQSILQYWYVQQKGIVVETKYTFNVNISHLSFFFFYPFIFFFADILSLCFALRFGWRSPRKVAAFIFGTVALAGVVTHLRLHEEIYNGLPSFYDYGASPSPLSLCVCVSLSPSPSPSPVWSASSFCILHSASSFLYHFYTILHSLSFSSIILSERLCCGEKCIHTVLVSSDDYLS